MRKWVAHAGDPRLDRVDFANRPPGRRQPIDKTSKDCADIILTVRRELKEQSALGEFGADAIRRELTRRRAELDSFDIVEGLVVQGGYGDKLALQGNIDISMLLPFGTPDEVEEAVKETIAKAAPNGGYIMRDSNAIHESVDPDNHRRMIEACRRRGQYPFDGKMVEEYRSKQYISNYVK